MDNKLTDNEIIKAYEHCKSSEGLSTCYKCPAIKYDFCGTEMRKISVGVLEKIVDLINRKNADITEKDLIINHQADTIKILEQAIKDKLAEIERLEGLNNFVIAEKVALEIKLIRAKSKAVKEFAKRLKEKATTHYDWSDYVDVEYIDNLVKEMTEGGIK